MLGVCVCGSSPQSCPDALFFSLKLRVWQQATFWKKQQVASEPRKQLEDQAVVLGFTAVRSDDQPPGDAEHADHRHFVHIGFINYTTWHFVVLRLYSDLAMLGLPSELNEETGAMQVGPLPPSSAGASLGVYTDLQFYRDVLDLSLPWKVQLYTVSTDEMSWQHLDSSSSVVPLVPWSESDVPPFQVWLGSAQEKANRGASSKPEKKRGLPTQKVQGSKRRRVRGKKSDHNFDAEAAQDTEAEPNFVGLPGAIPASDEVGLDVALDARGPYMEEEEDLLASLLGVDEVAAEAEHGQVAAAAAAAADEVSELWEGGSNLSGAGRSDSSVDPLAHDAEAVENAAADVGDTEPDLSVEERLVEVAAAPRPGPAPEPADDEPQAVAAPKANAKAAARDPLLMPRRVGGHAVERVDFSVGDYGKLRYYPHTCALVAVCSNRAHQDCRMERTCREHAGGSSGVFGGQGRPIGLLVSWLCANAEFHDQQAHLRNFRHTQAGRAEARAQFLEYDGAADFSARVERAQREGEPAEPARIR